jgi:hypothetical protein
MQVLIWLKKRWSMLMEIASGTKTRSGVDKNNPSGGRDGGRF